ncbi:thiaminase II [Volucribacter amazonae]|uniref:Aminopyrimidine aminohydrolase n=1 Tax=Volucribacter amazonae TaxID=256731 RepID=A0A9X4PCW4_9PAST|nr:thiaminase II [Volucribacter amazonae]MDG6895957.1 thiaminase II [Volucribacter amazonae]
MTFQQLKQQCPYWQDYINHPFVQQLRQGTLPLANFRYYLQQDYLFLLQFTRTWGLAVYKSDNLADMRAAQQGINAMLDQEIQLHIQYCQQYGVTEQQLQQLEEHPACIAYTRYVLDCGLTGTLTELHTALAPCILGYAEIGKQAATQSPANNPYQSWIDMYASQDYQTAAQQAENTLNRLLAQPHQQNKIQQIFNTAVRMEIAFWQMGLENKVEEE